MHLTGSLQDVNARAARLSSIDSVDSTHLGDWYGVIAGRAGWSADRALFYVKGGAAFINHNYSFTVSEAPRPFSILTAWFADAVSIFPTMR